jgi:Mg/Co/Ni transporter MgtE
MLAEKRPLSLEELEAQTALELPERETPVTVVVGCLAVCVGQIIIRDVDVNVAATICAAVSAITVDNVQIFSCTTRTN